MQPIIPPLLNCPPATQAAGMLQASPQQVVSSTSRHGEWMAGRWPIPSQHATGRRSWPGSKLPHPTEGRPPPMILSPLSASAPIFGCQASFANGYQRAAGRPGAGLLVGLLVGCWLGFW